MQACCKCGGVFKHTTQISPWTEEAQVICDDVLYSTNTEYPRPTSAIQAMFRSATDVMARQLAAMGEHFSSAYIGVSV